MGCLGAVPAVGWFVLTLKAVDFELVPVLSLCSF